jgi:cell division protein FtsB
MKDFQGRKRWRKIYRSDVFAFVLLVFTIVLLNSVWDVYKKNSVARMNSAEAIKTLEGLKKKKEGLEKEISRLSTERGVEEELRRRFQVVRPGEEVIVIVEKDEKPSLGNIVEEDMDSLWRSFLGLVFFWK